jgi:hypothetical protein
MLTAAQRQTLQQRIDLLIAAYEWEQTRLDNWRDEAVGATPAALLAANPMIARFLETWKAYFREVKASNQWIIDSLRPARAAQAGPLHDPMEEAARAISRIEHRKGSIRTIANAANALSHQSRYFRSLDAVIDLENEVRDHIERFLAV